MSRFLMCRPDYFGIEYEINPWMRLNNQSDPVRARAQWQELHHVLTRELGAAVELLESVKGLPDLVFTANAGYVEGTSSSAALSSTKNDRARRLFSTHGFSPTDTVSANSGLTVSLRGQAMPCRSVRPSSRDTATAPRSVPTRRSAR